MITTYNVYRFHFRQASAPDHVAIASVPAQNEAQKKGRFYHVYGDVGMGMDFKARPGYNFGAFKLYDRKECLSIAQVSTLGLRRHCIR